MSSHLMRLINEAEEKLYAECLAVMTGRRQFGDAVTLH